MLWNGLRELPSTNYRIFVSVAMEVLFCVAVLACLLLDRKIDVNIVWALGILITGWLGLGVGQFVAQRSTDRQYAAIKNAAQPTATVTVDSPTNAQVNVGPTPATGASSGERGAD